MSGIILPRKTLRVKPQAGARFNPAWPLSRGLQAFYAFLEGSGVTLGELSGKQLSATISGGTGPFSGSGAWQFNGLFGKSITGNSTVGWPNCGNICDNLSSFTVSVWFKSSLTGVTGFPLISKFGSGGFSSGQGWGVYQIGGQFAAITQASGGTNYSQYNTNASFNDGKWHHGVFTVSNYVVQKIYIDGVSVPVTFEGGGSTPSSTSNTNSLQFCTDSAGNTFNAPVDLIGIWNRVLTSDEIERLYTEPLGMVLPRRTSFVPKTSITNISTSGNLTESIDTIGSETVQINVASGNLVESIDTIGSNAFVGNNNPSLSGNLVESKDTIGSVVFFPEIISGNLAEPQDTIASKVNLPLPTSLIILKRRNAFEKPPLGSAIDPSHSLAQGLVTAWLMNEGGGNYIYDLISNMRGNLSGSGGYPAWQAGQYGAGLNFPGDSDSARVNIISEPYNTDIGLSQNGMSVSFWVKQSSGQLAQAQGACVMGKNDSTDGGQGDGAGFTHGWIVNSDNWHLNTPGYNNVTTVPGGWSVLTTGVQAFKLEFECSQINKAGGVYCPQDTNWHHVCITTAGAANSRFVDDYNCYLDGVEQGFSTASTPTTGKYFQVSYGSDGTITDSAYPLAIGSHSNGSNGYGGFLDTVLIYNRCLTTAETQQLYTDPFCFIRTPPKKIVTHVTPKLISKRFPFPFMKVV